MITSVPCLRSDVCERFHRTVRHDVEPRLRVDLAEQPALPVEELQGSGLLPVDVESAAHGDLVVVRTPRELAPVVIALRVLAMPHELHLVGPSSARADT